MAREEAERLAREEDRALAALGAQPDRVPFVSSDAARSGAACLAVVLRSHGRPVRVAAVLEACRDHGVSDAAAIAEGARRLGLAARPVGARGAVLHAIDRPLLTRAKEGHFVLLDRLVGGRVRVMDPTRGSSWRRVAELTRDVSSDCLELAPEAREDRSMGVRARAGAVLAERRCAMPRAAGCAWSRMSIL